MVKVYIDSNTNPTIDDIVKKMKKYNRKANITLIKKAYIYAKDAHAGQFRKSGEEYIIHPLNVAYILTDLETDDATICGALLHDVVEDTDITNEDIVKLFGTEIAEIIEGVTKLGKIQYVTKEEAQAENFRKLFLAMGKDIRVIMIKLADRLHNMRTLSHMADDRRLDIARETLEIYAPLANRLRNFLYKMAIRRFMFNVHRT